MFNLDGCNFSDTTLRATEVIYFATFYVILPYFLTLGLLSNCLLIAALVRRPRTKAPYAYQTILVCSKTFQNVSLGLFNAGAYWWAGMGGYAAPWFVRNYTLLFITMKLLPELNQIGYFSSLILSVAIAADRVFSLAKPLKYKTLNQTAHRRLVCVLAAVVAVGLSVDKYWTYNIVEINPGNGTVYYQYQSNQDYVNATWGKISESIRVYTRILCLILLTVLNAVMIYLHHRRMKRVESTMGISSQERIQIRKEANKDLTILTVCQSLLIYLDQIPNMVIQLLRQQSAYWSKCILLFGAEMQAASMLATTAEFFLFMAVNRPLRRSMPGYGWLSKVWPVFFNRVSPAS